MTSNLRSRAKVNIDGNPLISLSLEEREENQCEIRALDFQVGCRPVGKLPAKILHFPFSIFNSTPPQSSKTLDTTALAGGGGQNSRPYWITEVNLLELSTSPHEGEVCFQCENLSIRKQGEGLKVEKENTPLLWERIEHLTQSVESVLGEGSSRRVSNCKIKKFSVGLVNPTYKTLNFPHPLREGVRGWGLISSRRDTSRNNFQLSTFNSPFIQQPTTKEVFQC